MESNCLISICIPSYNRPNELRYLLNSIVSDFPEKIEIVICEDKSPKRKEIIQVVDNFQKTHNGKLKVKLFLNEINLGFDANLRECINKAKSKFVLFMGDDDSFVKNGIDNIIQFLEKNESLGYVMKSHYYKHLNGNFELFRYFKGDTFFDPGRDAVYILFRKSVFISGFCIRREYCIPYLHSDLDGTLLFQLYLLAEICLRYPSAYFDTPIVLQDENRRKEPLFGSSSSEKNIYTPGVISPDNSINFMKSYLRVSQYIDNKYNLGFTNYLKSDISKYSYPVLMVQREKGLKIFIQYVNDLKRDLEINRSFYFYIYYYGLIFLGKNNCDKLINLIKKVLGKTPKL